MPVPAKTTLGKLNIVSENPRIICGDCIEVGQYLLAHGDTFDFVFGDPPFNIGHGYADHDDNMAWPPFQQFMHAWLEVSCKLITPNGLFSVHVPDELAVITISNS